jgi:formylglycine-generating enzyme required for sulfatase activity
VTVAQYKACVDAGACTAPGKGVFWSFGCNWGVAGRENHPVNCVDWNQAEAFSRWAGGRLPSEAEWEYAARSAGKNWTYPWGDEKPTCERAVTSVCGAKGTAPVCSKPKGNTLQGLCDLSGNVWEWVRDRYHESYAGAPVDGGAWDDAGSERVMRGGAWDAAFGARAAGRTPADPDSRTGAVGFRPARDARR